MDARSHTLALSSPLPLVGFKEEFLVGLIEKSFLKESRPGDHEGKTFDNMLYAILGRDGDWFERIESLSKFLHLRMRPFYDVTMVTSMDA